MLTEPELRDFKRMHQEAPMRYRQASDDVWQEADLLDLSASGLGMRVKSDLPVGTLLEIEVAPSLAVVPPLHGRVEVMRSQPDGEGHALGCRFIELR
ncbi:MAG: PilZ domain-containing protein [Pseudomonadota bacterium]